MANSNKIVGIHLGANNARVAVYKNGQVIVLENDHGNTQTPCYVAFTEHEMFVGEEAKNHMIEDPENVVFDTIYLIGKQYNDHSITSRLSQWKFKVEPKIEVMYKNEVRNFSATQITACVLEKMKDIAEEYLGEEVTDAVITVPVYFNDSQCNATKDAALIANLKVLELMNEATAAAIAYRYGNDVSRTNIMVYHLGSTSFDVTILEAKKGKFEIKSTVNDMSIGGNYIDELLVAHCCNEFKAKTDIDLTGNKRALFRLRFECCKAKEIVAKFGNISVAKVQVDALAEGIDFQSIITRVKFEEICDDMFRKTLAYVYDVLQKAQLTPNGVNEVILTGKSTQVSRILDLLKEIFGKEKLNCGIRPNEVVVTGAVIQAATLGHKSRNS